GIRQKVVQRTCASLVLPQAQNGVHGTSYFVNEYVFRLAELFWGLRVARASILTCLQKGQRPWFLVFSCSCLHSAWPPVVQTLFAALARILPMWWMRRSRPERMSVVLPHIKHQRPCRVR